MEGKHTVRQEPINKLAAHTQNLGGDCRADVSVRPHDQHPVSVGNAFEHPTKRGTQLARRVNPCRQPGGVRPRGIVGSYQKALAGGRCHAVMVPELQYLQLDSLKLSRRVMGHDRCAIFPHRREQGITNLVILCYLSISLG